METQAEKIEYFKNFFSSNPNENMENQVKEDGVRYHQRWKEYEKENR